MVMPNTADLRCKVTLGSPASEILWYKGNKEVGGVRYRSEYTDGYAYLHIKNTQLSDTDKHKVVVRNALGEVQSEAPLTVHQVPKFNVDDSVKRDISIKANQTLTLEANFCGVPSPSVDWFLNDKPLDVQTTKISHTSTYTKVSVKSVDEGSGGTYKCEITNSAGSDTIEFTTAVINVPSAPQSLVVSSVTKDTIAVEWQTPESDGGSPINSYSLERKDMKRNTWVAAGSCAENKLSYTVKKLAEGNEYSIRVCAENDVGSGPYAELAEPVVAQDQFTVPSPPRDLKVKDITATDAELVWSAPANDGGSPLIGYTVERKSQFSSRWTKVNKSPSTPTNMKVTDLTEGNEYEFRVQAVNKAGASEPSAIAGPVTAKEPVVPVTFNVELKDVTVKEDMPATFECEVSQENAKAVWKKNGAEIVPSPKYLLTCDGKKHSLTITECQTKDEAAYEITFDSASSQAGLVVEKEPLEIIRGLEDVNLVETPKNAVFECEISKPDLTVKWIKDGQTIDASEKYRISSSGNIYKLLVIGAGHKDEGEYTILVKGLTSAAKLSTRVAPSLKLDKKYEDTVILHAGKSTIFEVPFQGYPVPEVVWTVDGKEIPRSRRIDIETTAALTCLRLKQAERADTADYSVSVNNELGSVSATIVLVVLDKPEPPENLEASSVDETAVKLTWKEPQDDGGSKITHYTVEQRDASRLSWSKVGKTVVGTTFTATNLREGQNYVFQVKAVNEINESEPAELAGPVTPISQYGEIICIFNYYKL